MDGNKYSKEYGTKFCLNEGNIVSEDSTKYRLLDGWDEGSSDR